MGENSRNSERVKTFRGVKGKLLLAIIPCVTLAIILIIIFSYSFSKKIITDRAKEQITAESRTETGEIETWSAEILSTLNMIHHNLDTMNMDEETKKAYLQSLVGMNENFPTGV